MNIDWNSGSVADERNHLIDYLDDNLKMLHSHLEMETFKQFLSLVGQQVVRAFYEAIYRDFEVNRLIGHSISSKVFINKLNLLYIKNKAKPACFLQWEDLIRATANLLYRDESIPDEEDDVTMRKTRRLIELHGSESSYLMQQYILERVAESTERAGLGSLAVRALFVDERLIVQVLNGRDLKVMDVGGSSDPYVKIQLIPGETFGENAVQKTRVHKKTLFPLFDETFIL